MIKRAVIPAAGRGVRLAPLSAFVPKELFPLGDKPVIQWVVDEALDAGIEKIAVIISYEKWSLKNYFLSLDKYRGRIDFLYQPRPLGLGDAICTARHWTADEPFAVLLPDNVFQAPRPVIGELISICERKQTIILAFIDAELEGGGHGMSFGIPTVEPTDEEDIFLVTGVPGKSHKTDLNLGANLFHGIGRYVLTADFFTAADYVRSTVSSELDDVQPLHWLAQRSMIYALRVQHRRFDTGNWDSYWQACRRFVPGTEQETTVDG